MNKYSCNYFLKSENEFIFAFLERFSLVINVRGTFKAVHTP